MSSAEVTSTGASRAGAIRPDSRLFIVGATGTGKSSLARWLWATQAGPRTGHRWRVLIDPEDTYRLVPEHGTCEARGVDAIDWRAQVIRFVPKRGDHEEYEELYRRLNRLPQGVCVWLDEAVIAASSSGKTLAQMRLYLTQGRKHRHMHIACAQFPAHIERTLLDQAGHVFTFQLHRWSDIDAMAKRMGYRSTRELADQLSALPASNDGPSHHFLWQAQGRPDPMARAPLSAEQLAQADRLVRAEL